jgi:hypothetical protein
LSSRIAALNLLELSLDHLGIQTRETGDGSMSQEDIERRNETVMRGLEVIVKSVGDGERLSSVPFRIRLSLYRQLQSLHCLTASIAILPSGKRST